MVDGGANAQAARTCAQDYPEAAASGVVRLCCLSVEVFGRWGDTSLDVLTRAARARVRGVPARVRLGTHLRLLHRWVSVLGLAVQRAVARTLLARPGGDLARELCEAPPGIADLPA